MLYLYQSAVLLHKFWLKAKIAKTCTGLSKELLRKVHTGELGPDGDEVPLHWQANFHKIFTRAHLTYLSYQIRSVIVPDSFSRLKEKRGTCSRWPSLLWKWSLHLDLPVSPSQMLMKVALGGSPSCLIAFECRIIRGKAQGQIQIILVDQHIPFGCTFLCYLFASGSRFQDYVSQLLTWCSTPVM